MFHTFFTLCLYCLPLKPDRGHSDVIRFMKIYLFTAIDVHKWSSPPPPSCCWQNCYSSPSKSRFKDQHLARWDGVCSGLHDYQVTNFKDTLPYTASDESKGANGRATLSFCHYHYRQGMDGSFFSIIIRLFSPPSINNGSEEYDLLLWVFWMAPNILHERPECREASSASETDP